MDSQVKWSSGLARGSIAAGGSSYSVGILRIHSSTAKREELSVRLLKQFLRNIKGVSTISRVCPISNGLGFFCVIALFVNDFSCLFSFLIRWVYCQLLLTLLLYAVLWFSIFRQTSKKKPRAHKLRALGNIKLYPYVFVWTVQREVYKLIYFAFTQKAGRVLPLVLPLCAACFWLMQL